MNDVPNQFVAGYEAAIRDLNGPHTFSRVAVICADVRGAAGNAYRDPEWLADVADSPTPGIARQPPREGRVYVMRDAARQLLKIGFTTDAINRRKAAVEAASGAHLEVIGSMAGTVLDEQMIHRRLAAQRVGGEWFRDDATAQSILEVEGLL